MLQSTKDTFFIGSTYEEEYGFSKAKKHNGVIYVSGCSGTNFDTGEVSPDANEQLREAFRAVEKALKYFGSDLSDLLQVQLYYSEPEIFDEVGKTLAEHLRPSASTCFAMRADLPVETFKIELVATARAHD